MATIVKRVVGALLALLGLALTVVGTWFATQLGSSGTAEFTVRPSTAEPVVIGPDVLNRVDADVVVTATPIDGGSVWMALANPSDATALLGDAKHLTVTGVSVADWALRTASTGSGAAPELGAADILHPHDGAVGICPQRDGSELFGSFQQALDDNGRVHALPGHRRSAAELAGGYFDIVRLEGLKDVLHRHLVVG